MQVAPHAQISGHLEKCCLLLSANESYERASQDIQVLTGMSISHSTQQRLVHQYTFSEEVVSEPVLEMSIDGGKVRLRTPEGQPCIWNDYKAICLHNQAVAAYFKDNAALLSWANCQKLGEAFVGLGDGHDGIWNLFAGIGAPKQRYEVLDWFHLKENLYKVPGSIKRIEQVEALLWKGQLDAAISQFDECKSSEALNFVAYLEKHRCRVPNYEYLQQEGVSIGSGPVESSIKQIGRRVKLSGAQWATKNVPQVLRHRCAYLNGYFSISLQLKNVA